MDQKGKGNQKDVSDLFFSLTMCSNGVIAYGITSLKVMYHMLPCCLDHLPDIMM